MSDKKKSSKTQEEQNAEVFEAIRHYANETTGLILINSPGMRVIKTALSVLTAVVLETFIGASNLTDAPIAATICLQNNLRQTIRDSLTRVLSTFFSGLYSVLFLYLVLRVGEIPHLSYQYLFLVGLFALLLMQILIWIKQPTAVANSIIVFVLISVGDSALEDGPIFYALNRTINTVVGILIAMFYNWLPPLNAFGDRYDQIKLWAADQIRSPEEYELMKNQRNTLAIEKEEIERELEEYRRKQETFAKKQEELLERQQEIEKKERAQHIAELRKQKEDEDE